MSISTHVDVANRVFICSFAGESRLIDFATVQSEANALAGKLGRNDLLIAPDELATRTAFEKYRKLLSLAAKADWTDLWYDSRTTGGVRQALQSAKVTGRHVRVFYGNASTGLDAMALTGVVGWICGVRVDGLMRVGLSEKQGSPAGHRVHELDVVRVVDVGAMVDVYKHPNYHLPKLEVLEALTGPHWLKAGGVPFIECEHKAVLMKWVRYFAGSTHEPPQLVPSFISANGVTSRQE
jgi:hypothetical protein